MKEILYTIKDPYTNGDKYYIFYKDGSYRVNDWPEWEYSLWKFENDTFFVKHGQLDWINANSEDELIRSLKLELAIAEMLT